jgi:hypothetical protein
MNDPQMLGNALAVAALALYARDPDSLRGPLMALPVLLLAGLVKHNIVAVPLAIGLDTLIRAPRRAMVLAGLGLLACAAAALALYGLFGPDLFFGLGVPRVFHPSRIFWAAFPVLGRFQALLMIGAGWLVWHARRPAERLVLIYLAVAVVTGLGFAGGAGTAENMFFDAVIAAAIGLGLAVDRLSSRDGFPLAAAGLIGAALTGLVLSNGSTLVTEVVKGVQGGFAGRAAENRDDVAFVRDHPGPAACVTISLCFRAGKPFVYDPFNATQAALKGRLDPRIAEGMVERREFSTIQLDAIDTALVQAGVPEHPLGLYYNFSDAFLRGVARNYRLDRKSANGGFFVPRGDL